MSDLTLPELTESRVGPLHPWVPRLQIQATRNQILIQPAMQIPPYREPTVLPHFI